VVPAGPAMQCSCQWPAGCQDLASDDPAGRSAELKF
jgi:hypothetical protein